MKKLIALFICLMVAVATLHSAEWTYFNNTWETFKPVDNVSGYQFTKELNDEVDALLYRVNKFPTNIFKDKKVVGNNIAKFLKEHPNEYARTWEIKDGKFLIMVIAYANNGKYVTLLYEETVEDVLRMLRVIKEAHDEGEGVQSRAYRRRLQRGEYLHCCLFSRRCSL